GTDGSMGISYGNLVAVAFQAIKELNQKVTDLQSQMKNFVFDKLTAKIAYVDDMNVKNLNADRVDVKTATTFHGSMNIDSSVCVDNVCVSKDKFKEFLLQTGGVTYGSAADQAKGINPLLNTVTTVNPTASATTTIEVATTTVPAVSTETATSTPVISTTPTIETIQATTTTLQSEPVTTVQSPIEQTTEPTTATSTSSK
ncbi:MAG: hypothetical protein NT077_02710, partial [Candidatus Taylorbacteria bacterium]|nr:hypothetical protein [Candidatus Taylorbacteria bacterium]